MNKQTDQAKREAKFREQWEREAREREQYQDVLDADERDQRRWDRAEQRKNG